MHSRHIVKKLKLITIKSMLVVVTVVSTNGLLTACSNKDISKIVSEDDSVINKSSIVHNIEASEYIDELNKFFDGKKKLQYVKSNMQTEENDNPSFNKDSRYTLTNSAFYIVYKKFMYRFQLDDNGVIVSYVRYSLEG